MLGDSVYAYLLYDFPLIASLYKLNDSMTNNFNLYITIAKYKKWSSKRMKRNAITNATALPPNILQYSNFYNNWSNFSKTKGKVTFPH